MPDARKPARVAAVVLGSGLIVAGVVATPILAFLVLLGTQVPDAYDAAGDPCCSSPDTWGESLSAAGMTLGLVFVVGLGLAAAIALLGWGTTGQALRGATVLLRIPAAVTAVALVVMAGLLFWQRDRVRLATDCDEFTYSAAAWQSGDRARWQGVAQGLSDCGTLRDQTLAQVRSALGPPDTHRSFPENKYAAATTRWSYRDALYLDFERGRLTQLSWDGSNR